MECIAMSLESVQRVKTGRRVPMVASQPGKLGVARASVLLALLAPTVKLQKFVLWE
jgi:hypothetical protein